MHLQYIIVAYYLVGINLLSYILMCVDNYLAKTNKRRIPETTLWCSALIFGTAGIYCGMKAPLYHKVAKTGFRIGIPFVMILQVLVIFFLFK